MIRTPIRQLALLAFVAGQASAAPLPKGDRTLAVDVNADTNGTYEEAFLTCKDLGVDEVKISLDWNRMDTGSGYDFTIPDIVNVFYPAYGMPVSLLFRPVTTAATTLPADIDTLPLNHPTVIMRFRALLDSVHTHTLNAGITAVFIGNEIGSYLRSASDWAAFTELYDSSVVTVKNLWGDGMEVGTIGMHHAMLDADKKPYFETLIAGSDIIGVTYYPQDDSFQVRDTSLLAADFDAFAAAYPDKPVWYTEAGYQTSAVCGSNERLQAGFISAVFAAWDTHADRIRCIDFAWMHDKPASFADEQTGLLGIGGGYPYLDELRAYLLSLGLRTIDGHDKEGWVRLKAEAAARGWGAGVGITASIEPRTNTAAQSVEYDINGTQYTGRTGIIIRYSDDGTIYKTLRLP